MPELVSDQLRLICRELSPSFCDYSQLESHGRELLASALGWTPTQTWTRSDQKLSDKEVQQVLSWVEKRKEGTPLQYLKGNVGFWKSEFSVGPGVLVPRRETEHMVERLMNETGEGLQVIELGAGSGNIGLSTLLEKKTWKWDAWEVSRQATQYLRRNHQSVLNSDARYQWHHGDFFEACLSEAAYDWVVSNPPYIASDEIRSLSPEVQNEPRIALDGGPSGWETLERIAYRARNLLKVGGGLLLEIGSDQGDVMVALLEQLGYSHVIVHQDYSGLDRMVEGKWRYES